VAITVLGKALGEFMSHTRRSLTKLAITVLFIAVCCFTALWALVGHTGVVLAQANGANGTTSQQSNELGDDNEDDLGDDTEDDLGNDAGDDIIDSGDDQPDQPGGASTNGSRPPSASSSFSSRGSSIPSSPPSPSQTPGTLMQAGGV
jgi:hypothetical protein